MNEPPADRTKRLDSNVKPHWAEPHRHVLKNGLRVLVLHTPHLSTASVGLFIRVGSRFEAEGEHGISHLVEHLLFRGCAAWPETETLNAAIEDLCPYLDASTGREFTALETSCAPEDLGALLKVIGAMVEEPLLQCLDMEREIILHEIADEVDSDGRDLDVDNVAKAALFPGPGLGWKIGGSPRSLRRLDVAACRRWVEQHYVAHNMVLTIACPGEPDTALEAAKEAFAGIRAGGLVEPPAPITRTDLPALETVQDRSSTRASLQACWVLPREDHADWPAIRLAHRLLEDGASSRLRRCIIDDRALAYHVSSDLSVYDGLSLLTIDVEAAHHQVVEVVDVIDAVLSGLAEGDIDDDEWERIRRRYRLEMESLKDVPSALCGWLGVQELYPPHGTLRERMDEVLAVSRSEMADACARYLDPRRRQLTVVGDLPPLARAGLRRRLHRAATSGVSTN